MSSALIEKLTGVRDLKKILETTVQELGEGFGAESCQIMLSNPLDANVTSICEYRVSKGDLSELPTVRLPIVLEGSHQAMVSLAWNQPVAKEQIDEIRVILSDLSNIIRIAQINDVVQRNTFRETFLVEIGNVMSYSLGIGDALFMVVNILGKVLNASRCIFICTDDTQKGWRCYEFWQQGQVASCQEYHWPTTDSPLVAQTLLSEVPLIVYEGQENSYITPAQEELQLIDARSFLGLSLRSDKACHGCVILQQCDWRRAWNRLEIDMVQNVADKVAEALLKLPAEKLDREPIMQLHQRVVAAGDGQADKESIQSVRKALKAALGQKSIPTAQKTSLPPPSAPPQAKAPEPQLQEASQIPPAAEAAPFPEMPPPAAFPESTLQAPAGAQEPPPAQPETQSEGQSGGAPPATPPFAPPPAPQATPSSFEPPQAPEADVTGSELQKPGKSLGSILGRAKGQKNVGMPMIDLGTSEMPKAKAPEKAEPASAVPQAEPPALEPIVPPPSESYWEPVSETPAAPAQEAPILPPPEAAPLFMPPPMEQTFAQAPEMAPEMPPQHAPLDEMFPAHEPEPSKWGNLDSIPTPAAGAANHGLASSLFGKPKGPTPEAAQSPLLAALHKDKSKFEQTTHPEFVEGPPMEIDEVKAQAKLQQILSESNPTSDYIFAIPGLDIRLLGRIDGWIAQIEAKDKYVNGHAKAVAEYAQAIAKQIGLTPEDVEDIRLAAILHDVGKLGAPQDILQKPDDDLTDEELLFTMKHPWDGAELIESIPELSRLSPIIRSHHEEYNGDGYPAGLAGENIPLGARIIHVADAYHQLTTKLTYRNPIAPQDAQLELTKLAGQRYDPRAVEALVLCLMQKLVPDRV